MNASRVPTSPRWDLRLRGRLMPGITTSVQNLISASIFMNRPCSVLRGCSSADPNV
jgi:hypothetical protein